MDETVFINDYNNMNLTVFDIKRKHGLNNQRYNELKNKLYLEGKISKRRTSNYSDAKYTVKLPNGKITIRKQINGVKKSFGTYRTEEDADTVVAALKKYYWDKEHPVVKELICDLSVQPSHIVCIHGRYYVYTTLNNKRVYIQGFKSMDNALKCRRLLNRIGWDKKVYQEYVGVSV